MSKIFNATPITGIARSITDIMGIPAPAHAAPGISTVIHGAKQAFNEKNADRIFMYNPDGIALWLYQKYTQEFGPAVLSSRIQLPMLSVMPSVTPVCFASMYTGAMPDVHGISAYEKPVLKTDTMFDAAIRAGKKCAIISTEGDSISVIFLERAMDYFIYGSVDECNQKAFQLIEKDQYDLIVLYNANYDSAMHKNGPESPAAMAELQKNIDTFSQIKKAIIKNWSRHRSMLAFAPDHGCHEIDGGSGSHGLNMEEDMNIIHMFDFIAGNTQV